MMRVRALSRSACAVCVCVSRLAILPSEGLESADEVDVHGLEAARQSSVPDMAARMRV